MADPTTPADPTATPTIVAPTAADLDQWNRFNQSATEAGVNLGSVNNISTLVSQTFNALDNGLKKLGTSFESLDSMTPEMAAGFGALTTSILGSKEAFTQLASVDTDRLMTFSGQVNQLFDIIKKGPGTSLALDAIDKLMGAMKKAGASGEVMAAALAGLKNGSTAVASAFLTSADNGLRLENAMIQLTLQAGNARDLFQGIPGLLDGVGDGFENVGMVMQFYTRELEKGTAALGGNQELAAKYMAEINRMPGGFKAIIAPLKIGSNETDILTASIQYATGAGRKQEEVFADMSKAMSEYSVSGGDALRFSARMTEVADNLGAQFKDVQSALHGAIDEFKMFVNNGADATSMTQGMADAMKNYVGQLVSVGVPAQNAIEMFKNYTTQMKNMSIGQQSFLSTMSGGPGGLRGALAVQEDIAKGNFDKVRSEVEATIKKISGPLITREEAMKSEAGASQYVRQMQVLQQGPLGGLAKSQGDADSLIRAMKEGKPLAGPGAEKTPEEKLQDTMIRGQEWQKGSYTELTKVNTSLQNILLRGSMANLGTTERMLTAAGGRSMPGGSGTGTGISPGMQERLNAAQATITTAAPGSEIFKQVSESVRNLPKTFQDAWKSFQEALRGGNKESIQQANDKMLAAIKDQKATWDSLSNTQKQSLTTLQTAFSVAKPDTQAATGGPGTQRPGPTDMTPAAPTATGAGATTPRKFTFTPIENYSRPGQRIPSPMTPPATTAGAGGTTGPGGRQAPGIGQGTPGQAVPVMLAPGSAITVNLTGVCPHCGADVRHSITDSGVSQTGNQRH